MHVAATNPASLSEDDLDDAMRELQGIIGVESLDLHHFYL